MTTNDPNKIFFDFVNFLKGNEDVGFEEVDRACLSNQLFQETESRTKILPLYFFLTRNAQTKMTIAQMKKQFKCGADMISRVRKAIREKRPIPIAGHKKEKPVRNDAVLKNLVDAMTRENGGVSSSKLANVLGVSESSINHIRHDLQYSFKPLRHCPVLKERHVIARLAFCQAHVNDDWSTTMFTDESRVASSPDCPIMWWVKKGDKIYTENEKFPVSIMVWAGIIGGRKTQLLKCPNRLNAKGYVDLLENNNIVQFLQQS